MELFTRYRFLYGAPSHDEDGMGNSVGGGANEERIGDDLWGACRCWRNNIIVNFAIAALLKYRGVGSIEQTRE